MKTSTLSLTAPVLTLTLACCCTISALAQNDSSQLYLGYLPLNRDLTQTITIKGADLEKMPFANLSDAIAAWLYGAYTQPATLLYVVDGSPVADVNAYSVFDIEEVVLVENAAAMGYTGGSQQEVICIKTRRGKAKSGMTAAAQTGLVSSGIKGLSTDTRWYHQYYLGANINPGRWRFGASASWLRDIMPTSTAYQVVTPDNLQRWRLHGYADWQPDRHQQLELSVGYVPEKFRMGTDSIEQQDYVYSVRNSASQRFFLPGLRWQGQWLGGLTNDLQASYVQSIYQGGEPSTTTPVVDTGNEYKYTDSIGGDRSSYHVYVRDRLAYRLAAGGWQIEPAMNVSYEHANERLSYSQYTDGFFGPGSLPFYTSNGGYEYEKYHLLFYTPQLDIHYKKGFDLVGGEIFQTGLTEPPGSHKAFFFISSSVDVLRLGNGNSPSGLAFFGSYAQRATPPLPGYQLADLTYGYTNQGLFGYNTYAVATSNPYIYVPSGPSQRFWVWDAGVRYTGWKDRLQIQGNIGRRNYALQEYAYVPIGGNSSTIEVINLVAIDILLHVDARVKILQSSEVDWQSGINATILHSKVNGGSNLYEDQGLVGYTGDVYPNPWSVTGGWVNRVRVRHFSGGLDLLYHFGEIHFEDGFPSTPVVTRKLNPVAVPNIYAGYRFDPAHHGLEIFVESRGLFRSNPSYLAETRRYYTVGGKLSL